MANTYHFIKLDTEYFADVAQGFKRAEIRYNDRDYQENDFLHLRAYNTQTNEYTGDYIVARITHILEDIENKYLQDSYVCLSIEVKAVHVERE